VHGLIRSKDPEVEVFDRMPAHSSVTPRCVMLSAGVCSPGMMLCSCVALRCYL